MLQLKFNKPIFHDGLNTVLVEVAYADGTITRHLALIEEALEIPFVEIPETALQLEHDPSCQNLQGLYSAMKYAYGDEFHAGSLVTVLYFTVR
jgi:hypothetical protein